MSRLSIETKIDILKIALQEDRTEIREIRDRIYSICTLVTVSSFAVTAFLLDPKTDSKIGASWQFFLLIDLSFILLLWVLFVRLKIDLRSVHMCLDAREDMIRRIQQEDQNEFFDPFPKVDMKAKPRIAEKGPWWIVGAASLALATKLAVISMILLSK